MTIAYPLTWPAGLRPAAMRFTPRAIVGVTQSPWTGEVQTFPQQGQWWEVDVTMPTMSRATGDQFVAWLLSLNGREGTFLLSPPGADAPRGVATGTPLVNGAGQLGKTLNVDGFTASTTNILRAGDWLSMGTGVNARLYRNLSDVNSGVGGAVALDLWPNVVVSPADNAAITVLNAVGAFRLSANEMPFDLSPPFFYGVTFGAVSLVG